MGNRYIQGCEKCKYTIDVTTGGGCFVPGTWEEEKQRALHGKYGKQAYRFFQEHPNGGSIDVLYRVFQCDICKHIFSDRDLSLYLNGECIEKGNHRCPLCKGKAERNDTVEADICHGRLTCPKCGNHYMKNELDILWD